LEKSRPVAAECQGSYAMSMPCDSLLPRSRRQQPAGRMIDE
jgi:hypothetical protein